MPRMDGVEFLQEAMRIFPQAKRALLYRLRRHERGDQRYQRSQRALLLPETVRSAGGAALSAILDDLLDELASLLSPGISGHPGVRYAGGRRNRINCATFWRAIMCAVSVDRC